jgi:teichuronic acid exporter
MNNKSLNKVALNGMSWNLFSRIFSNGSQLVIYFVLARLLNPTDFGVIAIVLVFINISNIFSIAGLGAAIIQNEEHDKEKFDTIYFTSTSLGILTCVFLYFSAPFIAQFYKSDADLVFLIRISSPIVIFNSINSIQTSILQRELNFKIMFYVTSIPNFIAGLAAVVLAYFGLGVYSLLLNNLVGTLISIIACFMFFVQIPTFTFNIKHSVSSLNYSYKILVTALLDEVSKSFFTLSIGKYYPNNVLGNYNIGRQIPGFASSTLNATIASVFFPFYAKRKSESLDNFLIYRKVIRVLNFIIFPCISIVYLISKDFVIYFFTEKWVGCIYFLNMFSIILGIYHLHTKITYYINAIGRSEVTLKYEFIKKLIGVLVLIVTLPMGIKEIVFGQLIVAIVSIILMAFPTKKYLNIKFIDQCKDIFPSLILNFILFLIVNYISGYINIGNLSLLIYPIIYLTLYLLIAFLLKMSALKDLISVKEHLNFK